MSYKNILILPDYLLGINKLKNYILSNPIFSLIILEVLINFVLINPEEKQKEIHP